MLLLAKRILARLLILLNGFAALYILAYKIFPTLENALPLYIALFVTYIVGAYLLFPFFLRLLRLILRPNHIPRYASTPDGFLCDPINIAIKGTYEDILTAMKTAGWCKADEKSVPNIARQIYAYFSGQPYPNAPFSTLYLFGRKQDVGFEQQVNTSGSARHHVRFWACKTDVAPKFKTHVAFWNRHYLEKHPSNQFLWVGAATKDIGIGLIRHNLQITHAIDPDTNAEREHVLSTLRKANRLHSVKIVKASEPHKRKNRVLGVTMIVDGELHLVSLNP